MTQAFFDFDAYSTGDFATQAGADFTVQATPGGDWAQNIVNLGGGDHAVRVSRTTGASGVTALVAHAFATTGDIEIYCEFTLGTTWNTNNFAGGALVNVDDNRAYAIRFSTDPTTDNFRLGLVSAAGSNNTSLGNYVAKTNPAAGTRIAVRIGRYNSSTTPAVRAKLWLPDTESEPGSWMWDAANSTLSNLRPGLYAFQANDNPFEYRCLGIGTGADSAPTSGALVGNASGSGATATASAPDGSASSARSITVTLVNGSGDPLDTVSRRFWTRNGIHDAAADGGAGGLAVTCNASGQFVLTNLLVLAGPGWLTFKDPVDDLNCHTVPVTYI